MQLPQPSNEVPPGLLESAVAPPPISNRLRTRFEELFEDIPYFVDKMYEVIHQEVPAYGEGASSDFLSEVLEMTRINMEIWFRVIFEERAPTEEDLKPVAGYARRRYHQGIPLTDLLHSFRSGASTVWKETLLKLQKDASVQTEMLMNISSYVLQHTDLLGQVLSHSYLDEAHRSQRWRDRQYQEFCTMVMEGVEDPDRFSSLAAQLGVDPNGRRLAMIVVPHVAVDLEESPHPFEEFIRHLVAGDESEPPHIMKQGQLIIWLPMPVGESPIVHENVMADRARMLCRDFSSHVKSIALGMSQRGAEGWKVSKDQASTALDWVLGRRSVVCYSEHILEARIASTPFDRKYFDWLLALISDDPALLHTLESWLNTPGMTRKAAAAALDIHPNTLDYRLKKIEQILGADLSDISWLARLHTALRLRG
ncbi:MAG: PucR family transcriptional regulator [Marinobacter sp.]